MKSSLISRIKRIETRLIPQKSNETSHYKYTFEDWELDDIKAVLFSKDIAPEIAEKWNTTDWGKESMYLKYLTVPELKRLEQIILEGEMESA